MDHITKVEWAQLQAYKFFLRKHLLPNKRRRPSHRIYLRPWQLSRSLSHQWHRIFIIRRRLQLGLLPSLRPRLPLKLILMWKRKTSLLRSSHQALLCQMQWLARERSPARSRPRDALLPAFLAFSPKWEITLLPILIIHLLSRLHLPFHSPPLFNQKTSNASRWLVLVSTLMRFSIRLQNSNQLLHRTWLTRSSSLSHKTKFLITGSLNL